MPNSLGPTGLQTATQAELQTLLQTAFKVIYGSNINIDPESPDGQLLNIFIQAILDQSELLTTIYNTFNPDNAFGTILDQRVAINGIQRLAGTFTVTNITLVLSASVNLYGLDQTANPVYTVSDNAGNQWELQSTHLGVSGTQVLTFQSSVPGAITTIPNTIVNPVTIVLGVTSINNPSTYTTLGINEESDAALKVRRQISVSLPSQGYLSGLLAALENINGVTYAHVEENDTGTTNADGVPGHSIWVITAGSGAASSIANAIYTKRNAGCGMYNSGDAGAQSYTITQVDGSAFIVYWDTVVTEDLFIKFTATSLDGISPPNIAGIRAGLVTSFTPGVNQQVNVNDLATLVQDIDPNTLVTSAGFSTSSGGSYTNTLTPSSPNKQFIVSSADIIITPMILSPTSSSVTHSGSEQFTGLGGYGTLTYTFVTNNSGGTINSSTGLYTAGITSGVTDTVRVTDSLAHTADATVTVT